MRTILFWLVVIAIGAANAIVLHAFEFVGVEGADWLWNELIPTDEYRWLVVPTAVVLGLVLTACFVLLKQKRVVPVDVNLMDEIAEAPSTLKSIGTVLLIGAVSLLAGASLGPEASLIALSAGLATYIARQKKLKPRKQLLILASVGALLVAFVNSVFMIVIPVLLLLQRSKKEGLKIHVGSVVAVALAGVASYVTSLAITHTTGHASVALFPSLPDPTLLDLTIALLVGFVSALFAVTLKYLLRAFSAASHWYMGLTIPGKDWFFGAGAGLVLGTLYFIGGRTVELSGSVGSQLLLENASAYGVGALLLMMVVKIVATAWSNATGYRGGLVFPSIYVGVAFGLLIGLIFPEYSGVGAVVGGVSGIITATLGTPLLGAVFLLAALPIGLWPAAFCAILGTLLFSAAHRQLKKFATI